jgi:hypothetical protein
MTKVIRRVKIVDPDTGELLHEILFAGSYVADDNELSRIDFSAPQEFLQGAIIDIPSNHSFRPHVHLERERTFSNLRAQESWVVVSGKVEVDYYTDAGKFLQACTLSAGDISISFRGGHGYRTTSDKTRVFEFKSGPYEGQEVDKSFID